MTHIDIHTGATLNIISSKIKRLEEIENTHLSFLFSLIEMTHRNERGYKR